MVGSIFLENFSQLGSAQIYLKICTKLLEFTQIHLIHVVFKRIKVLILRDVLLAVELENFIEALHKLLRKVPRRLCEAFLFFFLIFFLRILDYLVQGALKQVLIDVSPQMA